MNSKIIYSINLLCDTLLFSLQLLCLGFSNRLAPNTHQTIYEVRFSNIVRLRSIDCLICIQNEQFSNAPVCDKGPYRKCEDFRLADTSATAIAQACRCEPVTMLSLFQSVSWAWPLIGWKLLAYTILCNFAHCQSTMCSVSFCMQYVFYSRLRGVCICTSVLHTYQGTV